MDFLFTFQISLLVQASEYDERRDIGTLTPRREMPCLLTSDTLARRASLFVDASLLRHFTLLRLNTCWVSPTYRRVASERAILGVLSFATSEPTPLGDDQLGGVAVAPDWRLGVVIDALVASIIDEFVWWLQSSTSVLYRTIL